MTKRSMLIIDDDEDSRFMIKYQVGELGITSTIFEMDDGDKALNFLANYDKNKLIHGEEYPPSIVLLDINMPNMDGFEFLDRYHKLVEGRSLPHISFVMYTSSELEKDIWKTQCYEEVIEYIVKPISKSVLKRLLLNPV